MSRWSDQGAGAETGPSDWDGQPGRSQSPEPESRPLLAESHWQAASGGRGPIITVMKSLSSLAINTDQVIISVKESRLLLGKQLPGT